MNYPGTPPMSIQELNEWIDAKVDFASKGMKRDINYASYWRGVRETLLDVKVRIKGSPSVTLEEIDGRATAPKKTKPDHAKNFGYLIQVYAPQGGWDWFDEHFDPSTSFSDAKLRVEELKLDFPGDQFRVMAVIEVE